jgi:hexosaminidase
MVPMDVIPAPMRVQVLSECHGLSLDARTSISADPGAERVAWWLRGALGSATGFSFPPGADADADIQLRIDPSLSAEEYRLAVRDGRAVVSGGAAAGVFWGAQTLRQLFGAEVYRRAPVAAEWNAAACLIEDRPRFGWRGLLLDVARHFLPLPDVLRYLDLMAVHKLNVLHLHLTDDQGWRVQIRRYPRLTEVGAGRAQSMTGYRSGVRDGRPHGGYYTQDDLREIVAYAADRQITVVPEIDVPGHSQAAIAAYPELGNTDVADTAALRTHTDWGVNPNVLNVSDGTLAFYENVLSEVLEIFPSRYVHLGGDECPKEQWRASPAAQARIKELGLADEDELQSWFIRHFDRWLADRGRRLTGWDEILEGGLASGATVSSWRGYAGGVAAALAGHDVVMCPEEQVYLDHRESAHPEEPVPIGWVRSLEDVYRFEPVPPRLREDPEAAAHVIGTQANVWTEFMDDARSVDYHAFPRLAAFAEVAWSALEPEPERRDWAGFQRRMGTHYRRLDALGVEYRRPEGPLPWQTRPGVPGRPLDGVPPQR